MVLLRGPKLEASVFLFSSERAIQAGYTPLLLLLLRHAQIFLLLLLLRLHSLKEDDREIQWKHPTASHTQPDLFSGSISSASS